MWIFRIIGLTSSTFILALMIYLLLTNGISNEPMAYLVTFLVFLQVFHFFPVADKSKKFSDSLIGLWIEVKKAKLRKKIDG